MTKTLFTLGLIGGAIYLAQDKVMQWLSNVEIGFRKLQGVNLNWERSSVKLVMYNMHTAAKNSTPTPIWIHR